MLTLIRCYSAFCCFLKWSLSGLGLALTLALAADYSWSIAHRAFHIFLALFSSIFFVAFDAFFMLSLHFLLCFCFFVFFVSAAYRAETAI